MIAIDFGTSRIKLSYFDPTRGEARLMRLGRGDDWSVPSLFYLGPDGERAYGVEAAELLETDPGGVVVALKTKLRSTSIRANRQRATPFELLTLAFADLRQRATEELPALPEGSTDAVTLTFPPRFGPAEQTLLTEAAQAAGFQAVTLLSEPEAAARAWMQESGGDAEVVVVLDCGGGTADWACLQRGADGLALLPQCPPGGDEKLGGHDIDEELVSRLREKLEDAEAEAALNDVESRPSYYLGRMKRLKERYVQLGKLHRHDHLVIQGARVTFDAADVDAVFRDRFVAQLLQGFGPYIESVRQHSGSASPTVLLVGGSGRIPGFAEALQGACAVTATWWERSEFATVLGAALAGRPGAEADSGGDEPRALKPQRSRSHSASPPPPAHVQRETVGASRSQTTERARREAAARRAAEEEARRESEERPRRRAKAARQEQGRLRRGLAPHPFAEERRRKVVESKGVFGIGRKEREEVIQVAGERFVIGYARIALIHVAAGRYAVGKNGRRQVQLSRPFSMGEFAVTQRLYETVMRANPSSFRRRSDSARRPVEGVSWFEAVSFCNRLSERCGLAPAYRIQGEQVSCDFSAPGFRLPTEHEWEVAARAGANFEYAGGNDLSEVGWFRGNSGGETHPVGQKSPNGWGLYDLSGNVWEWCWDWYDSSFSEYQSRTKADPVGPQSGADRVIRGGCWDFAASLTRVAFRCYVGPSRGGFVIGFRLTRTLS